VERYEYHYLGSGTFGDVYKGVWKEDADAGKRPDIVVKVLRSLGSPDTEKLKKTLKVFLYLSVMTLFT
jgi:hypothetical protein